MSPKKKKFPRTRYQGSKYKLVDWIESNLKDLEFNTVLDAFSGTSAVSYLFKNMGKEVHTNDYLHFNSQVAKALIENSETLISDEDFKLIISKKPNYSYSFTIKKTFSDIYYLDDENEWLDVVIQNINMIEDDIKKSMFFWALYQSCISKRPYNLFHRKNLYVRTADVKRSFGNKTTWDRPFEDHFYKFIQEINNSVFDNGKNNKSYNKDVFDLNIQDIDLVYLDPPYIPLKGSLTLYADFYHFLEGMSYYDNWVERINYKSKNLKLSSTYSIWEDKKNIISGFEQLIHKFRGSIIVISYRSDGVPSIDEIVGILESNGKVVLIKDIDYRYVLSKNKDLKEVLIIGR